MLYLDEEQELIGTEWAVYERSSKRKEGVVGEHVMAVKMSGDGKAVFSSRTGEGAEELGGTWETIDAGHTIVLSNEKA